MKLSMELKSQLQDMYVGKNRKTALKSIDFVNLATGDAKVKKSKILKVLDNATKQRLQKTWHHYKRCNTRNSRRKMQSSF